MNGLAPRIVFYPTLWYNLFLEKVTTRQWYNRIDDTVLVGALPFKSMNEELIEGEGVRGVVSLNEDYELKRFVNSEAEWRNLGVIPLYLSTVDLVAAPSQNHLKKGVDFISGFRHRKESVYIHCKAGRTRSATLAACYMMRTYRCKPNKAVEMLKRKRPHIWLRQKQLEALDCFYEENVKAFDKGTEI